MTEQRVAKPDLVELLRRTAIDYPTRTKARRNFYAELRRIIREEVERMRAKSKTTQGQHHTIEVDCAPKPAKRRGRKR